MFDNSYKLSENFTLGELCKSQTAVRNNINNIPEDKIIIENLVQLAVNILQPVRDFFSVPFSPNSGYRNLELNALLKSSSKSQHCKGQAADIEIPSVDNLRLAEWIHNNLTYDQLILEFYKEDEPTSGWVHVSYNKEKNRGNYLLFDGKNYKERK
tara:strand:+ start:21 stop:485 length:465 start_codon:yes stop_codon:yes gene_type:complete